MLHSTSAFSLAAAIMLLSSCSSEQKPTAPTKVLAFSDFENFDGWLGGPSAALTRGQAHSGSYSTMVGPGQEYSLGYSNELSKLSPDWPAKVTISAWVLIPNRQAAAKLVAEIQDPNGNRQNLLWEGVDLSEVVTTYNKWQHIEHTINMPIVARPTSLLKVYLWRANSNQLVYLDDLKISLARP